MKINIAKGLDLPMDAVTQTFAQIGKRGAGKTYLATMIAEQMLDAGAQVIAIDPIGNWWGLRVDADGKSKGKDIYVMGGLHGDVSLSPDSGIEIAKILTEKNISVVLDVSEFRKNQRKKFITDFAEEFYHLKKAKPSAVHIFLEEAQKFCPQRVMKDETRMLGAWEDIVRLGRNCGIGCSLITQRPQSVNKEVLSQVECLCVLQVVGLHERKALEGWVQEADANREIVGLLPGLKQGEGFVWSPGWLRIFEKFNFNQKTTLDTSKTPKLGEATKAAKLSKMDIDKLQKFITDVNLKTKEDLKSLSDYKNKVAALNRDLKNALNSQPKPIADERALQRARDQGSREMQKVVVDREREFKTTCLAFEREVKDLERIITNVGKVIGVKVNPVEIPEIKTISPLSPQAPLSPKSEPTQAPQPQKTMLNSIDEPCEVTPTLGICARRIYSVLYANPEREITKIQLSLLSGYSVKSGGFKNAICQMNQMGLLERNNGSIKLKEANAELTEEGFGEVSKELWSQSLGICAKKIFEFLLENEVEFTKEEVAERVGYSITSGGFKNSVCQLNALGLIQRIGDSIKINPEILEL